MVFMIEKKVSVPDNVEIEISGKNAVIRGTKGDITRDFDDPRFNKSVEIKKEGRTVIVMSASDNRKIKAFVGTIAAHIDNMIKGVTVGYKYTMKIHHVHFPMSLAVKDNTVQIKNFLGEKGTRTAKISGRAEINIDKDDIMITGINLEDVGQTAANIERAVKLSKNDRRIFIDGIYLSGKFLQNGEKI